MKYFFVRSGNSDFFLFWKKDFDKLREDIPILSYFSIQTIKYQTWNDFNVSKTEFIIKSNSINCKIYSLDLS